MLSGTKRTMSVRSEQHEREKRAARLVEARLRTNLGGIRKVSKIFGWNENTYKAHEKGQNGFSSAAARRYAKAFKVSVDWLYLGTGAPEDVDIDPVSVTDVPMLSMVSAGQLAAHDGMTDFSECPTVPAIDLPEGNWIALRVDGDSMNKISPPGSVIFVNLKDRRLVHNACYVVADEQGNATYKRYRHDDEYPFQPASYLDIPPPEMDGAITVIGRVRRSVIDL